LSDKPRIFCAVAARPNFIKIAPILREIETGGRLEPVLVHTGQHYDLNMSDVFFRDLEIRAPDIHLGIGSGTHAEQIGNLMIVFERLCLQDRPDLVLVAGDVNATAACSMVAAKLHIPVAHVEAGLRSGDRRMPEEINRLVTDQLSDLLFTTCRDANLNLINEGIAADKIHFVGNVMVDSLLAELDKIDPEAIVAQVLGEELAGRDYALLTMHRPTNVDDRAALEGWIGAFEDISELLPIVYPVHPRTRKQLKVFGLTERLAQAASLMAPLGYREFTGLTYQARLVITDSGGLQEEATVLGVPCLTIRDTTERPVTITQGSNQLVGTDPGDLVAAVRETLELPAHEEWPVPELWDGEAAERIVRVLESVLVRE
jgi:UDP-N-acetylglucosamine 2-epimerase (non-hydrolysing)